MRKTLQTMALLATAAVLLVACKPAYEMSGIERSRILVDKTFDAAPDAQAAAFIQPYKHVVDSMMSPVVGRAAVYMAAQRPESTLSNLLADILKWAAKDFGEQPDFTVYNIGGMRAAFAQGDVTYGDVLDVAPFENKICFLTLSGQKVAELFAQIASVGGEGVSHGVELVADASGRLLSARLNGQPIDPEASYRVATLDYLAQGNDKLEAFKAGTDVVSPQDVKNNVRFIIMDYFRAEAAQGRAVEGRVEGRIVVNK